MSRLTVYGMSSSGNCYKVRLLLEQISTPYDWIEIDTRSGRTRSAEFLARNPNGRVPLLELAPGKYLAESVPSFTAWRTARPSGRRIGSHELRRCSGCSSSSTATSPASR